MGSSRMGDLYEASFEDFSGPGGGGISSSERMQISSD